MRVLGIDPGTAIVGWAVVEGDRQDPAARGYGAIRTAAGLRPGERLHRIYREVQALIRRFEPDRAAVEQIYFGHNTTTALAVGQARGVVLLALAEAGLEALELSPAAVKEAVCGYGRAEKVQIQHMVTRLLQLPEPPRPDDVADALAVAVAGYARFRYEEAQRR
ncbi:MAG: crossover junction endodeoxyribonuclease RuvC [Firmicutes bacterium]|nr:crossover junction endodeoxyribonuclease RuvC [Alicyclobacillaceae bacterium]MCL6498189.1 crossover junction endodeoxyribonuclease RuvC [Bacillota bacterium]